MTTCVLIDYGDALFTRQAVILSADHLLETLAAYADREPRILHLEGMPGLLVRIGMGGPTGLVLVTGRGGPKNCQFARAPTEVTENAVSFSYLGQASPFPPKYLLPAAAVIDIVAYIYRIRELPTWLEWEKQPIPA